MLAHDVLCLLAMMKRLACGILALCVGCGGSPAGGGAPDGSIVGDGEIAGDRGGDSMEAAGAPSASEGAGAADSASGGAAPSAGNGGVQAGILTAGVWDDNRNFDLFLGFHDSMKADQGIPSFGDAERTAARDLSLSPHGPKQKLDVQIVIDTTGSMGDEIAYLNRELDAITGTIQATYPGAQQRWSLVAYKDKHDEYVARWFDFRSDLGELHEKLATLRATGGGDFPEAPEVALDVGTRLSWRDDASTARLIFWVADAPHHPEDASKMTASLRAARDRGIHVYPVASSGIDGFTEYTMRSAAQLTGGRYVFLTDDSGVGGAHEIPQVPCFFVTKLDDAILRMVDIEMTGTYREPRPEEILRTGGDPQSGVCQADGEPRATVY